VLDSFNISLTDLVTLVVAEHHSGNIIPSTLPQACMIPQVSKLKPRRRFLPQPQRVLHTMPHFFKTLEDERAGQAGCDAQGTLKRAVLIPRQASVRTFTLLVSLFQYSCPSCTPVSHAPSTLWLGFGEVKDEKRWCFDYTWKARLERKRRLNQEHVSRLN